MLGPEEITGRLACFCLNLARAASYSATLNLISGEVSYNPRVLIVRSFILCYGLRLNAPELAAVACLVFSSEFSVARPAHSELTFY
jgi:hypothetical protein